MFNKGVMDADITVYVTYRDANNNLMSSGKYLGTISNGGKILERRANGNMIGYKGYLNDVK